MCRRYQTLAIGGLVNASISPTCINTLSNDLAFSNSSRRIDGFLYLYEDHQPDRRANLKQFYLWENTIYIAENDKEVATLPPNDRMSALTRLVEWVWEQPSPTKESRQTSNSAVVSQTVLIFCATKARCEQVIRMMMAIMVGIGQVLVVGI